MPTEDLTEKLVGLFNSPKASRSVVIVGSQWGDEGKGKQVDLIADDAEIIVRYNGGPNAGHGIVYKDQKINLHLIPSGAAALNSKIVLADMTAIPPDKLIEEKDSLPKEFNLEQRLYISQNANLITPMHLWEDAKHERSGKGVGSTRNGIRPCYEDKAGRRGITFGDILYRPKFAMQQIRRQIEHWGYEENTTEEVFMKLALDVLRLKDKITNTSALLRDSWKKGQKILYEGAQGTLLDVVHGSYRYVTSSNSVSGGACIGAGVGPTTIDHVIGIVKAVMTRVGDGPFPSELVNENLQKEQLLDYTLEREGISREVFEALDKDKMNRIRKKWCESFRFSENYNYVIKHIKEAEAGFRGEGNVPESVAEELIGILGEVQGNMYFTNNHRCYTQEEAYDHVLGMWMMMKAQEYGATTGRPRRTGWLDVAALRHSVIVNGLTGLAVTKLDCLGDLPSVKMVVGYDVKGEFHREIPLYHLDEAKPIFETLEGWSSEEVENAREFSELPLNAQKYVLRIAELTETPIFSIGVGPKREETISLFNPFTGEGVYHK